jgi:signal transduction histidine kinase
VNLAVLVLPVTGAWLFRFYENGLVRETEAELISQAVMTAGAYALAVAGEAGPDWGVRHWNAPQDVPLAGPTPGAAGVPRAPRAGQGGPGTGGAAPDPAPSALPLPLPGFPSVKPGATARAPAAPASGEGPAAAAALAEKLDAAEAAEAADAEAAEAADIAETGGIPRGLLPGAGRRDPDGRPRPAIDPLQPRLALGGGPPLPDASLYSPPLRDLDPVAAAAAEQIQPVLDEAERRLLSRIVVLDPQGTVASPGRARGLSMTRAEEVAGALEGSYTAVLRARSPGGPASLASPSRGTAYRVFCAYPVFRGGRLLGVVHLSRTPREVMKALYQERSRLLWAAAAAAAILVALSLAASFRIIGPLKSLASRAREVAEGLAPGFRARRPGFLEPRELALLEESVGLMAERLRRRSDYLKAFAGGVSHEFKTPLTSLRGALELVLDDRGAMPPDTRERFRGNILADLARLESLVARLLALARAEALEPGPGASADAVAVARELCERLSDPPPAGRPGPGDGPAAGGGGGFADAPGTGFRAEIAPGGPRDLTLAVDRDALETVLRNLLENSREGGARLARIAFFREGARGAVEVSDDGPGVPAVDAARIFTPFFTTRLKKGGTGLGLPLSRALLAPYQGDLAFHEPPSTFRITAPLWRPGGSRKSRGGPDAPA